jgi:hypothetical protein
MTSQGIGYRGNGAPLSRQPAYRRPAETTARGAHCVIGPWQWDYQPKGLAATNQGPRDGCSRG